MPPANDTVTEGRTTRNTRHLRALPSVLRLSTLCPQQFLVVVLSLPRRLTDPPELLLSRRQPLLPLLVVLSPRSRQRQQALVTSVQALLQHSHLQGTHRRGRTQSAAVAASHDVDGRQALIRQM
jgi:hypothetical protein